MGSTKAQIYIPPEMHDEASLRSPLRYTQTEVFVSTHVLYVKLCERMTRRNAPATVYIFSSLFSSYLPETAQAVLAL
jgi:hypothetical protein